MAKQKFLNTGSRTLISNADKRLPVTVITGFLGSGKTTLLSKLLSHPAGAGVAVIINEVSELPLDHLIVATPSPQTVVLSGACVCCSAQGDLIAAFANLLSQRAAAAIPLFSRVIVETTGIADPVNVAASILSDSATAAAFVIDGIVSMVDGVHGLGQLDSNQEAVRQVALADKLLISKSDLTDQVMLRQLRSRLTQINPFAPTIDCVHGEIDPAELLDRRTARGEGVWLERGYGQSASVSPPVLDYRKLPKGGGTTHGIQSLSLIYDRPICGAALMVWISMLATFKARNLLRVKALLNVDDRPVVLHGVQHVFHAPVYLKAWPTKDQRSRIVFIWQDMSEGELVRTLEALSLNITCEDVFRPIVSPALFTRFAQVARKVRDGNVAMSSI